MDEFERFAQDFVEATSQLVGGRVINIMNDAGLIIASTDTCRIHTFHEGAAEVLRTGKPLIIRPENTAQYQGAKAGYNMPIFQKDTLIGVVGISGHETEVKDVAKLLGVYVCQYFAQYDQVQKQTVESEIRMQLLRLFLLGDINQWEEITRLSNFLNLRIVFPVRVALISAQQEQTEHTMQDYAQFIRQLRWQKIIMPAQDVFGIRKNDYVIVLGCCKTPDRVPQLKEAVIRNGNYRLAVSNTCENITDIAAGMREVSILKTATHDVIQDMEENKSQVTYLFQKLLLHGGGQYAEKMYASLLKTEGKKQADVLLSTAKIYYEMEGSVKAASEQLHIHKNTLLYRMKHLYQLLGIETETGFIREFLVQLILHS